MDFETSYSSIEAVHGSNSSSNSWSISNGDGYLEQEVWESFVDHHVAAGMMLGVFVVSLSYPILHRIYLQRSTKYQELTNDQQLVVVQHTSEAIFLSIIFAPLSYLIASLFFEEQSIDELSKKVAAIGTFMFVIIIMYMIEIASRFRSLRPLVLAHHTCAYINSIYPAFFLTTANLKSASLLVYFITYEAITFVGLVMYRLAPTHRLTRPIIMTGMLVFGLSRPIQFTWILGSLVATWKDLNTIHAVLQIVLTTLFTVLQVYSLTIHWALYKKCGKLSEEDEDISKDESRSISRDIEDETMRIQEAEKEMEEGSADSV